MGSCVIFGFYIESLSIYRNDMIFWEDVGTVKLRCGIIGIVVLSLFAVHNPEEDWREVVLARVGILCVSVTCLLVHNLEDCGVVSTSR